MSQLTVRRIEQGEPAADLMTAWLDAAGLPTADLWEGKSEYFVFGTDDDPDGFGGLVRGNSTVMLRSFIVNPARRAKGLGSRMLEVLLPLCKSPEVWLLTTSAEPFFAGHGFERVDRALAPEAIAATSEFRDLCPVSAALMRLRGE